MEWLALSIGIGLVVSLIFTEAFGLGVGGMIVPGYLALFFHNPGTVVATLVAALATAWLMKRMDAVAIIFGRRRVVVTMIVGFAIASALRAIVEVAFPEAAEASAAAASQTAGVLFGVGNSLAGMTVIGFVIPGLVALWIARTGAVQTLSPLLIASSLVYLVLIVAGVEKLA